MIKKGETGRGKLSNKGQICRQYDKFKLILLSVTWNTNHTFAGPNTHVTMPAAISFENYIMIFSISLFYIF